MATRDAVDQLKKDWKSKFPDLDVSASLTLLSLHRASALTQRNVAKAIGEFGVHPSGFEVLSTLWRMGAGRGATLTQLAEMMAVTPASMTNRIEQLMAKGWIERIVSDTDRRVAYAKLTKEGAKLVEAILPKLVAAEAHQLQGLKKGDRKDLGKLLLKLVASLEGQEDAESDDASS